MYVEAFKGDVSIQAEYVEGDDVTFRLFTPVGWNANGIKVLRELGMSIAGIGGVDAGQSDDGHGYVLIEIDMRKTRAAFPPEVVASFMHALRSAAEDWDYLDLRLFTEPRSPQVDENAWRETYSFTTADSKS